MFHSLHINRLSKHHSNSSATECLLSQDFVLHERHNTAVETGYGKQNNCVLLCNHLGLAYKMNNSRKPISLLKHVIKRPCNK